MTIPVKYSCPLCGIHRAVVNVDTREAEDVVTWAQTTMTRALVEDHEKRSPGCRPETLSEVLIPIDGTSKVGGPRLQ